MNTAKNTLTTDETEKALKKLHRLAKKGELEVEDLLKLLKTPDAKFVAPLREMVEQYDWQPLNDQLVVPFASWVDVVCLYLEQGVEGLILAAKNKGCFAELALAALPELPTEESFSAFVEISGVFEPEIGEEDSELAKNFIYELCDASHRLSKEPIPEALRQQLIPILKKFVLWGDKTGDENVKVHALVPFRYVGTMADIDFVKAASFSEAHYQGTEKIVIKDIKKRHK
ncbi:hypothetical protein CO614_00955 [Lysobacteraceae bacterium NML120232]|nr:hypothetical protein CO614_00955 [Xanthomonadaceae bacterium NML120232]